MGFVSADDTLNAKTALFIDLAHVYELTSEVVAKTIEIRKNYKIKIADAIIAATAIVNNFTLLSRNLADFNKIKELLVVDPYTLNA